MRSAGAICRASPTCKFAGMRVCMHMYVYMYLYAYVIYIHMCIHTYLIYIHTYLIYIHTYHGFIHALASYTPTHIQTCIQII